MSDTLAATGITPYDPFSPLARMASIAQTNAATQGQQIQNQGSQLGLMLQRARMAPFLGAIGQGGATSPPPTPPLPPTPGNAGTRSYSLADLQNGTAPVSASSPSAGGQGAGGQGQPNGGAAPQQFPGDIGARLYGTAMPTMLAMGIAGAQDQAGALSKVQDQRRQALLERIATANPDTWNTHVAEAAQDGWLSGDQYQHFYGHPELQQAVENSLASPDELAKLRGGYANQGLTIGPNGDPVASPTIIGAEGAKAGAIAGAQQQQEARFAGPIAGAKANATNISDLNYKPAIAGATTNATEAAAAPFRTPITIKQRNQDGSTSDVQIPVGQWAAANGASGGGGAPTAGGLVATDTKAAPVSGATYASNVKGVENTTGNPAAKSPTSNAVGDGQFEPATWLSLMKTTFPQQTQSMSDAQILQARGDPELSQRMTQVLAAQNGGLLTRADLPVNAATMGLAGRLGGSAAISVLQAAPNTPLSSLLSAATIRANPDLQNATAGSIVGYYKNIHGTAPVSFGQPVGGSGTQIASATPPGTIGDAGVPGSGAGATGGGAPAAPVASPPAGNVPQGGAAAIPGAIVGSYTPTPGQAKGQELDAEGMNSYRGDLVKTSQAAVTQNAVLDQMRGEAKDFMMGRGAEDVGNLRTLVDSVMQTFGIPESQQFTDAVSGWQGFMKNGGALARAAAHELGSRTGVQELAMIQKTLPSDEMSPEGFNRIADQLQGMNDYNIAKSNAAGVATGNRGQFDASWNQNVTPTAFIVNRMSSGDLQTLATKLGQTAEGRETWASIKSQMQYAQANGLFAAVR